MKLSKDTKAVLSDLMAGVGLLDAVLQLSTCTAMKMRFTTY